MGKKIFSKSIWGLGVAAPQKEKFFTEPTRKFWLSGTLQKGLHYVFEQF